MESQFSLPTTMMTPDRLVQSTWLTHIPFGMYLVELLRPRTIVELGTYRGASYCAFCQAVETLRLSTRCYGIDTWAGDPQSGYYGADVLSELRGYHDPLYGRFSCLLQSSFDDALSLFQDNSIGLLHIDGQHTYEAAKHDYLGWLPKVGDEGVIVFHDICVRDKGFGVWRLWEDLKVANPSFEFSHGHGLGLIAVGEGTPAALDSLFDANADERARIRRFFEWAGEHVQLAYDVVSLRRTLEHKEEAIQWARQQQMEEARMSESLPYRVARAIARYGIVGALRRYGKAVGSRPSQGASR